MKQIYLRSFIILSFFFASYCFAQTPAITTNALPQFTMWPGDIGTKQIAHIVPPSPTQTNYTVRFFLDYNEHGALHKFTEEHLHQRVQFVLEGRIVGELYLTNEITNGEVDLPAKTQKEAEQMAEEFNHG